MEDYNPMSPPFTGRCMIVSAICWFTHIYSHLPQQYDSLQHIHECIMQTSIGAYHIKSRESSDSFVLAVHLPHYNGTLITSWPAVIGCLMLTCPQCTSVI